MALDKVIDSAILDAELLAVADAIRAKGGTSDVLAFPEGFVSAVEAISVGGGSGGIGAVKFVDVDITVEASTTTKVDYTVDGLEFVSSVESPTKWNAFFYDDVYIAFVTPKEITGTATGNTTAVYNSSMIVMKGNTNYTQTFNIISYGDMGIATQTYGIYSVTLYCDSVTDGKIMGHLTASVRNHSNGDYEVVAGTYNVQVWHLTDFDWGHP